MHETITNPKDAQIMPGTQVRITGLQKRSDSNGQAATVLSFHAKSGRYKCKLASPIAAGDTFGFKLENLEVQTM